MSYRFYPTPPEVAELVAYLKLLREEIWSLGDIKEVGVRAWGLDNLTRAADLLEQLSAQALQPVPVSERLPGPEDCDAEGRCWLCRKYQSDGPTWRLTRPASISDEALRSYYAEWLPAHALPVPTTELQP